MIIAGALLGLLWESFYVVRLIDEQYGVGGSRGRWVAPIITRVLMWAGCLTVLATASFNRTVGFAYRHAGTIASVQIAAWNMENIVSPLTGMTSKVNEIAWVEDHQYKYFANPVYMWCLRLLLWSFTQNFYPLLFSPHRGPHEDRMLLWGYTFNQFLKCESAGPDSALTPPRASQAPPPPSRVLRAAAPSPAWTEPGSCPAFPPPSTAGMSMLMTFLFPPEGSSMDPRTIPVFFVITFPLSVLMSFFLIISIRPRWLPGIEARDPTRDGGLYGRLLVLVHNPKIVSNFTNFTFNIGLLFSLLLAIDAFGVRVDETGFWRFTILLLTVSSYRFGVFIKDSVIRGLLSNLLTEEGAKVVIEGIFYSGRNRGKKGTPDTVDACDAPAPPLRDGDSEAPPDGFFATGRMPPSMCETHGSFGARGRGQREIKSVTQKAGGAGGLPTLLEVPTDGEALKPSPGGSRLLERPWGSLRRSTHGAAATSLVKRAPSRASRVSRLGGTQRHSEFGNDMTPLETILCMGTRTATLMPPKMTIPKNHLVTAIFCDIVGYTTMSSECDPADVFDMLHVFFNKLDLLLPVCRCFKYQTVGDAYVAISNYDGNMTGEEHSMAALRFAFAMIHVAGTLREPRSGTQGVQIRVGIHSGPLAACVLGVERPALTLIGDTINTASRMESNSLAAHVRMSDETYRLLPKVVRQDLAPEREDLEIKGKGTMTTHLVSGIGLRMCDRVWDWVPRASTGEMSCEGRKSGSGSGGGATRPVTLSNSRGFEAGADPRSATPTLGGMSDLSPTASGPRAVNAIAPDKS